VPPTATNVPPTATSVPPTATSAPAGFYATITGIQIVNGRYNVRFDTNSVNTAGGDHVIFYFDNRTFGIEYYQSGLFTGYAVSDRPQGATAMCVISAAGNGANRAGSGNCWPLPSE
jgi:hypothetical protein